MKPKTIMPTVKGRDGRAAPSLGIGTRMSQAIVRATGKQPCKFCRKVRDTIDAIESKLKGTPMKKLIAAILLTLTTWSVHALDWTYSTNLYYNLSYPTNIYMGTNSTDATTNGDSFYQWGTKLNGFMLLYQRDKAGTLFVSSNVAWSPTVKDPTGFLDTQAGSYICTNITSGASNWFTWTGSNSVLMNGVQSTLTNVSILVPTNTGTWFIYKPNGGSSFIVTNAAWDLSDLQLATVYSDGTNAPFTIRETHGVMGWQTHRRFHLDPQLGGAWISGFTFATNPPLGATIGSGTFFDEDIFHSTPQTTNIWLAWQKVGGTALNYRLGVNLIYTNATGGLQYDNAGTLTDAAINNYVNHWIYVIPNADTNKQIVSVIGRTASISLSTIRAEDPPTLIPGFASQEAVLLHRATFRNQAGNPTFIESTDYRQSKLSGGSTISGATGTFSVLSASVVNGIITSASEASVSTTTNADQLTTGTLADARLSSNVITTALIPLAYSSATNVLVDFSLGRWFSLSVTNTYYLIPTNIASLSVEGGYIFITNTAGGFFGYAPTNAWQWPNAQKLTVTTNLGAQDLWNFVPSPSKATLFGIQSLNFKTSPAP